MKIIAALSVPVLAVGLGTLVASPASAHTPAFSASCDGVHVGATAYDAGMANKWSVTIGGVTESGTFGSSFDQTFAVPQDGATTSWSAFVEAEDGTYHFDQAGSVGPCGTPPPVDVCTDLPGNQPEGTACTPPPDVQRSDAASLDGCDVTLAGTSYGAGTVAYQNEYTDTYVFNEATNTFDLVTDTTPTIADVVFTPWTVAQQVAADCVDRATKPQTKVERDRSSQLVCANNNIVTTVTTTRTPYVYDEDTNTWSKGTPVEHTTTTRKPARPGACSDVSASHSSSSNNATATPAVATSSAAVPTVIDAGLAGAAPTAAAPTVAPAAVVSESSSSNTQVPALLLIATGLAFVAGALRIRRS